jgi:hypothetical protein
VVSVPGVCELVLEGGTTPIEAAVSDIWDVSAFCAVARMASKRERKAKIRIIFGKWVGCTENNGRSTDRYICFHSKKVAVNITI